MRIATLLAMRFLLNGILSLLGLTAMAGAGDYVPRALPDAGTAPWGNPATAVVPGNWEVRSDFWNGASRRGQAAFYAPLATRSAGVLGYSRSEPWGLWNQRMNLGGVVQLFSATWLGGRSEFLQSPNEQSLDLSVGAFYRLGRHGTLGWDVRHLLESWPADSLGSGERQMGVGAAVFLDSKERVAFHGDVSLNGFERPDFRSMKALGGMRLQVGDSLRLEFAGGTAARFDAGHGMGHGPADLDAYWRFRLGIPMGAHLLYAGFGGENYRMRGASRDPELHVSLDWIAGALRDRSAPLPVVRLDSGRVFVLRVVDDRVAVRDWQLLVHRSGPDFEPRGMVRRFAGVGDPPARIAFDGRDYRGDSLAPGFYAFRLLGTDAAGNAAWSSWQFMELP